MALNITRGKIAKAQKVVVYGPEGIGKTTFAAQFPNPLFIDTEAGTQHYDVIRIDPAPQSWTALTTIVKDVKSEKPCSTLVLDTADWAEAMAMVHVCAINKWPSIETPGYGAGYTALREEFGKFLNLLTDVAEVGINVVVTAHATMRKFDQPDEAASYDRWELKLQKKSAPLLKEWADAVLFANYKTIVETVSAGMGQVKGKARGGQKRIMRTQHHACWDAKNRWGLPEEIPFDYAQITPFIPAQLPVAPIQASAPQAVPSMQQMPSSAQSPAASTQKPVSHTPPTMQQKPVQSLVYAQDGTLVSNNKQPAAAPQLPAYFAPLLQLMESNHVTVDEVRNVVAKKGHFTLDTPFANYPQDYVEGVLIGAWPQVFEAIDHEVPFK